MDRISHSIEWNVHSNILSLPSPFSVMLQICVDGKFALFFLHLSIPNLITERRGGGGGGTWSFPWWFRERGGGTWDFPDVSESGEGTWDLPQWFREGGAPGTFPSSPRSSMYITISLFPLTLISLTGRHNLGVARLSYGKQRVWEW